MILLIVILAILAFWAIYTTDEDQHMKDLKKLYYSFIQRLPEKYSDLKTPMTITGTRGGDIGTNVNKGSEIYICIDGTVNDSFHVLLHELAHSTVEEYDHSVQFWENFSNLKKIAIDHGYYTPVHKKEYCGKMISDD